jgi:hypothetical protein
MSVEGSWYIFMLVAVLCFLIYFIDGPNIYE